MATGENVGRLGPTSNLSQARVTATGSSTARSLAAWMADVLVAAAQAGVITMRLQPPGGASGGGGLYITTPESHGGSHVVGFSIDDSPLWELGMDFENEDFVLAYSHLATALYPTADMIRIMRDRRMVFGPEVPKLNPLDAGFFNIYIPPTTEGLAGVRIREYLGNAYVGDALQFERYADADRHWVHWKQGTTTKDWRLGMVQESGSYHLDVYHANGSASTPASPGTRKLRLYQGGGLATPGPVISNAVVLHNMADTETFYIDCSAANFFTLDSSFSGAGSFTVGNPINATTGQEITIRIRRVGAGLPTVTWESSYKMAGAFVVPAQGNSRSVTFVADGNAWIEKCRNAADVPY